MSVSRQKICDDFRKFYNVMIMWCNVEAYEAAEKQLIGQGEEGLAERIREYCRDCKVGLRRLNLLLSKYLTPEKIPEELMRDFETMSVTIIHSRFNKLGEKLCNRIHKHREDE